VYVCKTDPRPILDAGIQNAAQYIWTWNGNVLPNNTQFLTADSAGVYTVEVISASGCTGSDVIMVYLLDSLKVDLGPDLTVCVSDPRPVLDAGTIPGATYVWTLNGVFLSNSPTIIANQSGTYVATIISPSGCVGKDEIKVDIVPSLNVNLGPDIYFCPTSPIVSIQAPVIPGANYSWTYNGQPLPVNGPNLLDSRVGLYEVKIVTPGGCLGSGSVRAYSLPAPSALFTTSVGGFPVNVSASNPRVEFVNLSSNYDRVVWNFGDSTTTSIDTTTNPVHYFPPFPGEYYVTLFAYNGNCVDSIKLGPIKVTPVEEAFIPSAFTPNFDGINDEFYFPYLGYQTFTIEIYNRWGQLVFTNDGDPNRYWKGYNMDGIRCEEGIYSYVFKGVKDNGESVKILGTVTLLR